MVREREAPITHAQASEELEPGFRKVRTKVSGYRGFPKNAEIALYGTEADKAIANGVADEIESKSVDAPPANKMMKEPKAKK